MAGSGSQNLTKRACDAAVALAESGRDTVLWDGTVRGFGLRVSPNGHRSFVLMYRAGRGRSAPSRKVTIGTYGSPWTVEAARTEAKRLLGLVAAGEDPAAARAAVRAVEGRSRSKAGQAAAGPAEGTVASAVEEWLRRDQAGNRTVEEVRRIMEREVLSRWGDRPLDSVRKRDVVAMIDEIADRAPVHANRVLSWVSRFFRWCAGRDLCEGNPAQYVEKPGKETKRDRVLSDSELVEVWQALDRSAPSYAAGVRLLIVTAARRDEIFRATRDELDFDERALRLPAERSKSKQGRSIPLSAPALALVEALPVWAGSPSWLLSTNGRNPFDGHGHAKAALDDEILARRQRALVASGGDASAAKPIAPWRVHDLRRTAATGMQRLGCRLEAIEAALGHISGSRSGIVGVYQRHAFTEEAREALDAWGRHVAALLAPPPSNVVPLRGRGR